MAGILSSEWGAAIRGISMQFKEFFDQNQASLTTGWDPIVKTETDDSAQATFSGKTGMGLPTRTAEGGTFSSKNRYKLYDTTFTHSQYTAKLEITRMQVMNRDFNKTFDESKDFARSFAAFRSKMPAQIFNRAFTSGNGITNAVHVTVYQDGKALASTTHPRVDGGSAQSNASSTGIKLTESNMEIGRIALVQQLQDDGVPMSAMGKIFLVVPTALEKTATIITGSTSRSGTTDNDLNFYSGGMFDVMATLWLGAANSGSDTAWFLVAPNVSKLKLVIRNEMQFRDYVDEGTANLIFTGVMDASVGSADWRGFWGAKGDNLAYSG